jgi:parallel beta-helix repeat protein
MRKRLTPPFIALLALLGSVLATAPAQAAPVVYLDETFSDSPTTLTNSWFDADIGYRNRITTISDGSDGPGTKVSIPAGSHFGSAMHWQFGDQGIPDPEELYFRYYLRIPDGFTNYGRGKLPGPAGLYSGSARDNIKPTDSSPGWSARMFFSPTYDSRDGDHTQLGYYVYHRNQSSDNGDLITWDTQTGTLRHGAWYCVEGHVDMNTPGKADGLLEGWVDEQLAFYQDDFVFRGSKDTGINVKSFWFDVYYGGTETAPGSLSFDFDSLVLSSERIGCGDTPVGGFRDIGGSVHATNIEKLAYAEITKGCNPPLNDLYCPDDSVTRGQMAAFLGRALDLPASSTDFFADDNTNIFEANINALAASGITKGCSATSFCPTDYVTRGQMAAFLDRALNLSAGPADRFEDDDNSIFEAAIDRLAAAGITSGCNPPANTNFCPNDRVTREQMASFLSRALDLPAPPAPERGYTAPAIPAGFDAVVPVGWSIQEVADSQPTGARIYIEAGTHLRQTVVPKANQEFVGAPGAVMDGLGEFTNVFSGTASGVKISGLEIKNYTGSTYTGAIDAGGTGWTITDCDVHNAQFIGISIKGGSTVSDSYVHHNKTFGIYVNGGSNATISNNEVAYNNYDQTSSDVENAAGIKFYKTTGLRIEGNNVHDNRGRGLWAYTDNTGTRVAGNSITNNWWAGVFHDHSFAITITGNTITGNGSKADASMEHHHGGIEILGPNATVTDNVISNNHEGVVVVAYSLTGSYEPNNTTITGNTIANSGNTGIVTNGDSSVFDTATIDGNDYRYTDATARHWVWNAGGEVSWDTWRSYGNDKTGSLQ